MLNRGNNQTNRHRLSTPTFKTVSSTNNNTSTTMEIIERKIGLATEGLQRYVGNWLRMQTSNENAITISDYVLLLKREINPSQNYRKIQIQALVELSEYLKQKPFKQLTTRMSCHSWINLEKQKIRIRQYTNRRSPRHMKL